MRLHAGLNLIFIMKWEVISSMTDHYKYSKMYREQSGGCNSARNRAGIKKVNNYITLQGMLPLSDNLCL